MKKNLIRLITLFLGLICFSSIPIVLFGINYEALSLGQKALYMFGCDLVYLSILLWWNLDTIKKDFKNFTKDIFGNIETSFKYYILGFISMVVSNLILIFVTNGSIAGNEEAVRDMIDKVPLYMGFSTILYAPLTEEIIFRKCIKDIIKNKWLYILLSGLIFGGMHIIGSAKNLIDVLFIIPYSSLGIAFAYTYYKTDNIFSTIVMHSVHNTFAFVLYLITYGMII